MLTAWIICVLVLMALRAEAGKDVGVEGWFTSTKNVSRQCSSASLPSDIDGSFVIAGPGVQEMGRYNFSAVVDGFGQFYKFEVGRSQICFSSMTMLTKFWNQSVQANAVAPGMLFMDTTPPRPPCPMLEPFCDALGGNDNVFINMMQLGDVTLELTDSAKGLNVDWHSLQVLGDYPFKDDYLEMAHVATTGSAHPIPVEDGYVALIAEMPVIPENHYNIDFVKVSNADKGLNRKLLARMHADVSWYLHSYGLTRSKVIVPLNVRSAVNMASMSHRMDVSNTFIGNWAGIAVLNISGGLQEPRVYETDPFWHTHIPNAFEQEDGSVVVDIVTFKDNMFTGPMVIKKDVFNKTTRDANPNRGVLKRYTLHNDGTVSTDVLSNPNRHFDFTKINPSYQGKPYCYVYGCEDWHDDESWLAVGQGKIDLCSGTKKTTYWYRENWYPSEASFLSREGATEEDDGYLLFAALNGETQNSHFVVLNAKDMTEISNTEFHGRVAFTIHANFLKHPRLPTLVV